MRQNGLIDSLSTSTPHVLEQMGNLTFHTSYRVKIYLKMQNFLYDMYVRPNKDSLSPLFSVPIVVVITSLNPELAHFGFSFPCHRQNTYFPSKLISSIYAHLTSTRWLSCVKYSFVTFILT